MLSMVQSTPKVHFGYNYKDAINNICTQNKTLRDETFDADSTK